MENPETKSLFAALNARLEHAERRYIQEQKEGDAISIASARAAFLGWRDARDLVKHHLSSNIKDNTCEASSSSSDSLRKVPCCLCGASGRTTPEWVFESPTTGDHSETCMQCNGKGYVFQA